jgi:DNA-binding NarL/FixJ family response regulator
MPARQSVASLRFSHGLRLLRTGRQMATIKTAKALTAREIEIVGLVREGLSNREIAGELGIAEGTVKIHLNSIFTKKGIRGRLMLIASQLSPELTESVNT